MGRTIKNTEDAYVLCPFYHNDVEIHSGRCGADRRTLVCEGVLKLTATQTVFKDRGAKEKHKDVYCRADYKTCPLHNAIMQKYE